MSDATRTEAGTPAAVPRLSVLALSGVSALGAAVAMVASLPVVAGLLALPALGLAGLALMRSVLFCLVLVVFFQHNDIFMSLAGLPFLNKLLGALALLAVTFSLTRRDFRNTLAVGFLPLLCWLGVFLTYAATILIAQDPSLAAWTTQRLFSMGILTLLFAFGVRSLRDLRVILNVLIASMALSAGVTVIDYAVGEQMFSPELRGDDGVATWEGVVRSTGTTLQSVPMSATLLLGGVMLAFVHAFRSPRWRWLYGALAILGAVAILLSLTRSATLSLGLAGVFMLWRLRAHPQFGKALGGILLGAVLVVALTPDSVWSKFGALSDTSNDSTVLRRASYQVIGVDLLTRSPLLGIGAGNYIVHYASDEYRFVPGRSEEPRPLHNVYLQVAAESGIVGFMFFVTMLWSTARILFDLARSANEAVRLYAEALLFAFLAMAVQFIFLSSISVLYFWVIIGLAIALRRIAIHDLAQTDPPHPETTRARRAGAMA